MVSIGICGASGCGKSLLTKQLAAMNCVPALFEGEMGTFPPFVIHEVRFKKNPVKLFAWFVREYEKKLKLAEKLSAKGFLCFVDGVKESIPAHKILENPALYPALEKTYAKFTANTDIIVLLIVTEKKVRENIAIRARSHEQNAEYMSRSMSVQKEFIKLLKNKKNVLFLKRDKYDFMKYKDVVTVNRKILTFAKKISH